MAETPYPTSWTDADFESMSWHDNTVHAIRLRNPESDYSFDLILELDHILEWMKTHQIQEYTFFKFAVAPARLTFHDVDKLHIDVELTYKQSMIVYNIEREEITAAGEKQVGLKKYKWTIALDSIATQSRRITFESSGFDQQLTGEPVIGDRQDIADDAPTDRTNGNGSCSDPDS